MFLSAYYGLVVQLVRTLACHARGRGFEPHPGRQFGSVAQLVEQGTENPRVTGSIPVGATSGQAAAGTPYTACGLTWQNVPASAWRPRRFELGGNKNG